MMSEIKRRELKRHITQAELARQLGVKPQALSRALNGGAGLTRDKASRAAAYVNKLTSLNCFEPHDFNSALSPNLLNVQDDVWVEVADLHYWVRERMTAKRFRQLYSDDLDALHSLNNLIWDGERQLSGNIVLSLIDDEDYTDV